MSSDSTETASRPDWFHRILMVFLGAVAIWLLAMPWVPAIARTTMRRFHLQTDSFAGWAAQQVIPAMYNFANTVRIQSTPPPATTDIIAERTLNHFPVRDITFANARARYLRDDTTKWYVLESTYRGQAVRTVYQLVPSSDGGWTMTRVDKEAR